MRLLGVAEAFGSPWVHSFRGWLALLLPSTVLVILQEADTPFPHLGVVVLSAIVQHCCAGLTALPLIALRRRGEVLPVWAAITTWTLGAVARAVTGVAMVAWFADADADFGYRVVSWLLIAWTWMPLLSYAVAQLEHRQRLLAGHSEALRRRDEARGRREQTAEQIRGRLVSDVDEATTMVIAEIELALEASMQRYSARRLELISDLLTDVSAQSRMAVERLSEKSSATSGGAPVAAPMLAALNFQREQPWRWSTLSAVALASVMLPISFRAGGLPFAADLVISLIVTAVTLAAASPYGSWGTTVSARKAVAWSAVRHGIAGLAGAGALVILRWDELDTLTVVLLLMLPYGSAVAAEVLSATVGVVKANEAVLHSIAELDSDRHQLELTAWENENRIRQELYDVMHGPILGRLSSCAMALNFLAADSGTVSDERIATVTAAVLDHLNQAMQDLSLLKN